VRFGAPPAGAAFGRRLAVALGQYEVLLYFLLSPFLPAGPWARLFTATASFAVYGTLFPLLAPLWRLRPARWLATAFIAAMPAFYLSSHLQLLRDPFGLAAVAGCFVLGVGVLFAASPRLDRWLRWLLPAAWLPTLLALALWFMAAEPLYESDPSAPAPSAPRPNLVLVSWDTVRADVLDLWGGHGAPTPRLDALAARSLVFDDAVAHAPITGPSHATMLTGLHPPTHGLRSNGDTAVSPEALTLPELLDRAGYRTGGFVSAYPVKGKFGFHRGFQRFDDRFAKTPLYRLEQLGARNFWWLALLGPLMPDEPENTIPAPEVNARAVAWLDEIEAAGDDRPFFLFVHYYDAHGPYEPAPEWLARAEELAAEAHPKAVDPDSEKGMLRYRAEISQLDADFGVLLDRLEQADPGLRNTLVVVTSDHGECFGEGGIRYNHVPSLYEATQHVPLVVHLPGDEGAGRRIAETVTHVDLFPTFLAAAGVPDPTASLPGAGVPLQLALGDEGLPRQREVYMEAWQSNLGDQRLRAWRSPEWKAVRWKGGRKELWQWRESESEDVSSERPDVLEELLERMRVFLEALPKLKRQTVQQDAEGAQALQSLGYADGAPGASVGG